MSTRTIFPVGTVIMLLPQHLIIDFRMTKFDIRNYFEKIYNIKVRRVNTRIQVGEICYVSRITQSTCNMWSEFGFDSV